MLAACIRSNSDKRSLYSAVTQPALFRLRTDMDLKFVRHNQPLAAAEVIPARDPSFSVIIKSLFFHPLVALATDLSLWLCLLYILRALADIPFGQPIKLRSVSTRLQYSVEID